MFQLTSGYVYIKTLIVIRKYRKLHTSGLIFINSYPNLINLISFLIIFCTKKKHFSKLDGTNVEMNERCLK